MTEKLSFREKVGYSLGDMAANFIFQTMLALQLSFYTDTFGLTAASAGTLFLAVGLGGRRHQSGHGAHRGSNQYALGQVSTMDSLDGGAVWHHRGPHVYHP